MASDNRISHLPRSPFANPPPCETGGVVSQIPFTMLLGVVCLGAGQGLSSAQQPSEAPQQPAVAPQQQDPQDEFTSAPPLVTVGQPTRAAILESIDADGRYLFRTNDGPIDVSANDLVSWGHPADRAGQVSVALGDGSLFVAADAWTVKDQLRLDAATIRIETRRCGAVELDRRFVGTISLRVSRAGRSNRLLRPDRPREEGSDAVFLTNGDRLRGAVRSLGKDALMIEIAGAVLRVDRNQIEAIRLLADSDSAEPRRVDPTRLILGLLDGTMIANVGAVVSEKDAPGFRVESNGASIPIHSIRDVVFVQSQSANVRYLSDVRPERYVHVPYLQIPWQFRNDRCVLGGRLRVGGRNYFKGIGVHSAARLVYKVEPRFRQFAAEVAIDDAAKGKGSARFSVFIAKSGEWIEAFTSAMVRGGEDPRSVRVDLAGARGIALVVDYADRGDERDYADWLNARLE